MLTYAGAKARQSPLRGRWDFVELKALRPRVIRKDF